jgi:hypothetical protein
MAGSPLQDEDYALVLLDRICYLNEIKDWARVIAFANKALEIAPAVYNKSRYAGLIDIAKFRIKDYKDNGVLDDFRFRFFRKFVSGLAGIYVDHQRQSAEC